MLALAVDDFHERSRAVTPGVDREYLPTPATAATGISENELPAGFTKTPTVTQGGKKYRFDNVPGHYWKVLDDSGYTVGLHVQTDEPFPWAKDAEKGELLRSRATAPTAASSRQLWDAHSADEGAATARVGAAPERRRRAISIGPAAGTAARLAATSNTRAAPPMLR